MPGAKLVEEQYPLGHLLGAIREGLRKLGLTVDTVHITA